MIETGNVILCPRCPTRRNSLGNVVRPDDEWHGPHGPRPCCSCPRPLRRALFCPFGGFGPAQPVSQSARAALPEQHRWGCLQDRHSFLPVLEAGGLRLGCHMLGLWRGLSPGLQTAAFSLRPHMEERGRGGERDREGSSCYKDTDAIVEIPPSRPHLNLAASQRSRLLVPSHWA